MPRNPEPTWMERLVDRRPPYFWWLLAIILCSCFTILSWALGISIFNQPELPKNYETLRWLGRLPVHESYTSQNAPKHPASSASQVRKSYLPFNDQELEKLNHSLKRSYLTNFQTSTFCTYMEGDYRVVSSRKLTDKDFISKGFIILLQAYTQPDEYSDPSPYPTRVELIIPTPYADSYQGYHEGDPLELAITPHFASLIHVSKLVKEDDETIVVATAISLAQKLNPPHAGSFDLAPPQEVNLGASFPAFAP